MDCDSKLAVRVLGWALAAGLPNQTWVSLPHSLGRLLPLKPTFGNNTRVMIHLWPWTSDTCGDINDIFECAL